MYTHDFEYINLNKTKYMSSKHYLATKYTQIKDYKPMVNNTPDSELKYLNLVNMQRVLLYFVL